MTFPEFLRAQVERMGAGVMSRGEPLAAIVLGVSPRTVRNWMYETGAPPSKAEQAGARVLLPQAGSIDERDKRLRRRKPAPTQAPQ